MIFWCCQVGIAILVFPRNEITVVVIEYIDYFLVIIINEIVLFICILVVCTLPIFCIVCTVLGFKHVTVLVQYNRYQQIVDVLSLQCASESIKVRPPFFLASSTRHARSETFNKNSVHSGLFGLLLYFLEFIDGKTQRSHRKSTNVVRMHESDELGIRRSHVTSSYHYVIYMMPSSFINWFL